MNISPLPPQRNWIVLVSLAWGILSAVGTLLFMLQALGFAPFLPAYAYMPLYILIPFGILGIIVSIIAIVLQKSARHLAIIGLLLNATTLVPTGIFLLLDTSLLLL